MKTKKSIIYKIISLVILFGFGAFSFSQEDEIHENYKWTFDVSKDVKIYFNNYDCDVIIKTWDRPRIEFTLFVDAEGISEEDAKRLDAYLEKMTFNSSTGLVEINTKFWDSRVSSFGRTRMKIRGEKDIKLKAFETRGELYIPADGQLALTSKYSNIELGDINGRLKLDLYNDKLFASMVGNHAEIKAKYTNMEFADMRDVSADLYNCDIEAGNMGHLDLQSKYSKVFVKNAEDLKIDSYNDKLYFDTNGDLSFTSKYSSFTSKKSGHLHADNYNSTMIIEEAGNVEITSKYTKYEFKKAGECIISSSYNETFQSGYCTTLDVTETKYTTYKVDELVTALVITESYNDKFTIARTGADFGKFKFNSKYWNMNLGLSDALNFKLKANVKYPKFDINEEAFSVRIKIQESSNLEYEGVKGSESPGIPLFEVSGYDLTLNFHYF